jgi:raffinose/stachyose/melibiose transport system permease protein
MQTHWKEKTSFALFVLPALALFILFYAYPIISGFYYAFTSWNSYLDVPKFIGLENFKDIFHDDLMKIAIKNNVILTIVVVLGQNLLAIGFALLLNQKIRGMNLFRAIIFIPVLLSTAVISYVWGYILDPLNGLFTHLFSFLHMTTLANIDWLGDPSYSLYTVCMVTIWEYAGFTMVIYLAGLKTIPAELYEAANMDGAGLFDRIRHITLPLLAPSITINSILTVIGCLKLFDQIYLLTEGGPAHSTEVFGTLIYNIAFKTMRLGYGNAIALVLTLVICLISLIQYTALSKREVQY